MVLCCWRYCVHIYLLEALPKISGSYFDQLFVPVGKVLSIEFSILLHKESWLCFHQCILDDGLIQLVDVLLRILHDIEISEPPRRVLDREASSDDKRILAMSIESFFVFRLVLTAECQLIAYDDSKMHNSLRYLHCHLKPCDRIRNPCRNVLRYSPLVVQVDYRNTIRCVDVVIMDVLNDGSIILRAYFVSYLRILYPYCINILDAHIVHFV